VLASADGLVTSIALDRDYVYWGTQAGGSVNRVKKTGGAVEPIATGEQGSYAVTLDANYVYWVDSSVAIRRAAHDGGPSAQIVTGANNLGNALAVDDTYIYFATNDKGLERAPKVGGGTPAPVAPGTAIDSIAVDDAYVYWASPGADGLGAFRAPKGGGGPYEQLDPTGDAAYSIAIDDSNVYWGGFANLFVKAKPGGLAAVVVHRSAMGSIAPDGAWIYLCEWDGINGKVSRVSLLGLPPETVFASGHRFEVFQGVAVDATSIYWATSEGRILSVAK
jgi:hypothetical protein